MKIFRRLACRLTQHVWEWSELTDENGRTLGFFWVCRRNCGEKFFNVHGE